MIDYKLSRVKVHLSDRSHFREKETKKQRKEGRKKERKGKKSKLLFFLERVLYKEMNPRPWNFVLRCPTTKFSMLLWIFLHL